MEIMEKKMETTIMGLDRKNGNEPLTPRPSPVKPETLKSESKSLKPNALDCQSRVLRTVVGV